MWQGVGLSTRGSLGTLLSVFFWGKLELLLAQPERGAPRTTSRPVPQTPTDDLALSWALPHHSGLCASPHTNTTDRRGMEVGQGIF